MNWQEFYNRASALLEEVPAGKTRSLAVIAIEVAHTADIPFEVEGEWADVCNVELQDGKAIATFGLISFEAS